MRKRTSILVLIATMMAFISIGFVSCEIKEDVSDKIARQQEQMMKEADAQTGMPNIVNFQERKMAKMILELRDQENLICYAYIIPEMTGNPVFLGKCIGYGLPYATQFTNPMKTYGSYQGGYEILPQADPNGLFMPASADGTWLLLIDPETEEARPVYCEPKVLISPFKLH